MWRTSQQDKSLRNGIGTHGLHVVAYAKALEKLTSVEVTKLLLIPNLSNNAFSEAKKFMEQKLHLSLYTFSQEDYKQAVLIWNGPHPDDGQECYVVEGRMPGELSFSYSLSLRLNSMAILTEGSQYVHDLS